MMIKQILLVTFIFAFLTFSAYGENNNGALKMSFNNTEGWTDMGKIFKKWEVTLTNTGMATIVDATINVEGGLKLQRPTDIWNVEKVGLENKYHFPAWVVQSGLKFNSSLTFGYINEGSDMATFSICDIQYKN